ncbi:hypothetical protein MBAV_002822 [Candidatus Magnetobacterium bavaricum]|uniref:Uncharacterized protein n=1 Tax=Candidatus Magnetobacterium bavaricum TaxID=29290 RepID=A0A0F3GT18_9BACT|nr:hypothetical protein MBAV_002822 [Candidatus Magnetobacterium bavaricum]
MLIYGAVCDVYFDQLGLGLFLQCGVVGKAVRMPHLCQVAVGMFYLLRGGINT